MDNGEYLKPVIDEELLEEIKDSIDGEELLRDFGND